MSSIYTIDLGTKKKTILSGNGLKITITADKKKVYKIWVWSYDPLEIVRVIVINLYYWIMLRNCKHKRDIALRYFYRTLGNYERDNIQERL